MGSSSLARLDDMLGVQSKLCCIVLEGHPPDASFIPAAPELLSQEHGQDAGRSI